MKRITFGSSKTFSVQFSSSQRFFFKNNLLKGSSEPKSVRRSAVLRGRAVLGTRFKASRAKL